MSAGRSVRIDIHWITIIGYHTNSSVFGHCQPGSTCFQITTAKYLWMVIPKICCRGFSIIKLISIACNNQLVVWMVIDRKKNQAHGGSVEVLKFGVLKLRS